MWLRVGPHFLLSWCSSGPTEDGSPIRPGGHRAQVPGRGTDKELMLSLQGCRELFLGQGHWPPEAPSLGGLGMERHRRGAIVGGWGTQIGL